MKILFVGLGNLGSQVLDLFLLRATRDDTFLVAGRNLPAIQQRVSWSSYAAMQVGAYPDVSCTYMDVQNIAQTAETIASFKPGVIFSSITMLPSSAVRKLPSPLNERVAQARSGPWLPTTLVLMYKLMQAVKQAGLPITVLNGAAPDNAHAVLSKVELAPTVGVGKTANIIPALRKHIAVRLHQSAERVQVLFVGHNHVAHHIRAHGGPGEAPYHLSVLVDNEDITALIDPLAIFSLIPEGLQREYTQLLSAASAASVLDTLNKGVGNVTHAPGPNGLPGAYPIRGRQGKVEVVLSPALTLEQAIHINQKGQRLDGIERIENDGTVYFAESNMAILKETLGYECRRMPLSEVQDWAEMLQAKYMKVAATT